MLRLLLACSVTILMLGTLLAPRPSAAQNHRLWVGLDLDLDDSTGCSLHGADSSGDQTAYGFEWVAEVSITPSGSSADVVDIQKLACDDAETRSELALASQGSGTSTSWSVGVDRGEAPGGGVSPGDVVELEIDTTDLGAGEEVRIAVLSESADGHRDTLLTLDGTNAGASIVFPSIEAVPALSNDALGMLVLFFFASALLVVRRSPWTLALWIFALGLSAERTLASITLVADGQVDDWGSLSALASDFAEDSETNDPSADILALFVDWSGSNLAVRVDVADLSAELCVHAETRCYYVSEASGDDGNDGRSETDQWATLSHALMNLDEGARLVIEAGDYTVAGKSEINYERVHIVADDGVRLHNTIEVFKNTGTSQWDHVTGTIYRSVSAYEITSSSTHSRAWGRFYVGEEAFMLMPYACYEALSSTNYFYPADESTLSKPPDCDEKPYIGPGIYWDKDGSQSYDLGLGSSPGHIFIRMDSSPEPLNSIVASEGWVISSDPNDTVMEITIDGPRLQLGADNILVRNLTMELGSIRIGTEKVGGELRDIVLDGPTYDAPIEIYTGASHHLFDGLTIEQNFPAWITWKDTKKLFYETIRYSAISLNGRDADDITNGIEAIHDITLRNSTIQNVHDGLELNGDSYHHLYIADNDFLNAQDDAIQLGSSPYEIEIAGNYFEKVGTSISRHGTGANEFPGYKYIHHNYIDASTPKYYCRETASGEYGETTCDSEGKLTLRGFHLHDGSGWDLDGDPRYYYNNTVVVNADMIGIGFQGQDYDYELPYGQPSLVFNNVFVQLDETESFLVESPKWSILAPPVLITGGNLYYQPPPPYACYGGKFPGELGHTYRCDSEAVDDPCNGLCVKGNDSELGLECDFNSDCDTSENSGDGRCSNGANCQMTDRFFEMSGSICGLADFKDYICDEDQDDWTPQLSPEWTPGLSVPAGYSWELEENGITDTTGLLLDDSYVPYCETESTLAPIDLTSIDGAYSVTAGGSLFWELSLAKPLPGVDPGDPYRGATPCVSSGE